MAEVPTISPGPPTTFDPSDTLGEMGGQMLGGWLGAGLGELIAPPVGGIVGGYLGRRFGRYAGRAFEEFAKHYFAHANNEAGRQLHPDPAIVACATCPPEEIPCFKTPPKGTNEETDRQLKLQQDAINEMSPGQLLNNLQRNRDASGKIVRPPGDRTERQRARDQAELEKTDQLRDRYIQQGKSPGDAEMQAEQEAGEWMRGQAALHGPDIVAGGGGGTTGTGDMSVNSSLGTQWNQSGDGDPRTRAKILEQEAANAQARHEPRMNVRLKRCQALS